MSPTGKEKKRRNRQHLRTLGHESTASALAEIRATLPWFCLETRYPCTITGRSSHTGHPVTARPSLATLVLHVRGAIRLTFEHDLAPRPHARTSRRSSTATGGDFPHNNVWNHLSQ